TPRIITNENGTEVWRWDSDPFGTTAANEDPDGDGVLFGYNLRFPGQYFDAETGLHYNYFRDYDPATGRYVESDPVGLDGGLNTYAYVASNLLRYVDPLGLVKVKRVKYQITSYQLSVDKNLGARNSIAARSTIYVWVEDCCKQKTKHKLYDNEPGASPGIKSPTVDFNYTEAFFYSYYSDTCSCDCTETFAGGFFEGDPDFWADRYLDFLEALSDIEF
ncbi:MAG: RHS repeat-associated core domain-containing protein, partial [Pseudomonadota bacterium]